jgi:hypothetical protein
MLILTGWLGRREREAIAYLVEENRCLRRQLRTRRLRLTNDDRRRLGARAYRVGRAAGEPHFRRAVAEFVAHYHDERNHQGLDNHLIAGLPVIDRTRRVRQHRRLGGLLNYYERAA